MPLLVEVIFSENLALINTADINTHQETSFTNSLDYSPAVETETTEKIVSKIIDDTFDPDTKNRLVKEKYVTSKIDDSIFLEIRS